MADVQVKKQKRRRSEAAPTRVKTSKKPRRKSLSEVTEHLESVEDGLDSVEGFMDEGTEVCDSGGEEVSGEEGDGGGEEGDGGGEGVEGGSDEGDASGKGKKARIEGLYKPPTHDELQSLKETQNLFKSNLMKLQITELLEEVKPKKNTPSHRKLEELLHKLRKALLALPSTPQVDLCEGLDLLPAKVKYPLPFTPEGFKGKFKFGPPSAVKVVGSYLLGTLARPDLNVDVELSLPPDCLQVKDSLNYRYFHKRALYLSLVAGHLKKKKKSLSLKSISFEYCRGNPLVPVLRLVPEGKHISKYSIHLHTAVLDHTYFKPSKLGPDRNNVRAHFLSPLSPSPGQQEEASALGPPTPHYNTLLLAELGARERHLKELFLASQECPGLVDAVVLFKVWATQRELNKGYRGFTGFHCSMLINALVTQQKVNHLMSCYQIFRVVLQQLASTDWTTKGFHTSPHLPTDCSLPAFHSAHEVVFLDSSNLLNLCACVSKDHYRWLKQEAVLALELLDSAAGFQSLFMRSLPVQQKFDMLCCVSPDALSVQESISEEQAREAILLDGFAWPLPLVTSRAMQVLHRGLDKRVKLLAAIFKPQSTSWLVSKDPPDPNSGQVILGLLLDTTSAFSILTMGPPADSSEAVEFRSFWGERSELRRFDDGAINEAVIWCEPGGGGGGGGGGVEARKAICFQMVQQLLHRHFSVAVESTSCSINLLSPLLQNKSVAKKSNEELMEQVLTSFTELSKDLRRLKDLPLTITSLQGTSATFRYTEVFPSPPWNGRLSSKLRAEPLDGSQSDCYYPSCEVATPPFIPVHPVVCQLESSGKWPEALEAIEKIKTAFYVHMSSALREQKGLVTSPTQNYLDILKNGHVFRLKIHHHRELVLLKERLSDPKAAGLTDQKRGKEEVVRAHREIVALPILTSTLSGLQQQFPSFGGGTRLCKRWVSAHLLSNHISDEAVELLVASLFTSPAPYITPCSDLVVFTRFLSLLATFDWESESLIVNFNNELSDAQISDFVSEFSKNRACLPPLVIMTPHDQWPSSPWCSALSPSAPIFHRLQQLAHEALGVVCSSMTDMHSPVVEDVKCLFRTPLHDFDLLIHLNKKHVPLSQLAVDTMATGPTPHKPNWPYKPTHFPVVNFDPAQLFLKELEVAFAEFALFFYDKYGGSYIAVLWKPQAFLPQDFKVGKAQCKVPVNTKRSGQVVADKEAIIADFELMGQGLVRKVECLTQASN